MNNRKLFITLIVILITLSNCSSPQKEENNKIQVVCTTGMIGDAVINLLPDNYTIQTLMGPGVDPHLYKATQGDLKLLSNANLIVYNGLHLEGKMGSLFEKLENQKDIIAAAEGIDEQKLINNTDFQGAHDPHLWFDVVLWKEVVQYLEGELIKVFPKDKEKIQELGDQYQKQLSDLQNNLINKLESLDTAKRILVTAHDAFSYFGRAYHFQVKGLQGISTASEYGLRDVSDLVSFLSDNQVKAVFVESSVSDRSIKAVIEGCKSNGHDVKIGGTLYSDAMGAEGTAEGTYIGMVEHNMNTIIEALK